MRAILFTAVVVLAGNAVVFTQAQAQNPASSVAGEEFSAIFTMPSQASADKAVADLTALGFACDVAQQGKALWTIIARKPVSPPDTVESLDTAVSGYVNANGGNYNGSGTSTPGGLQLETAS